MYDEGPPHRDGDELPRPDEDEPDGQERHRLSDAVQPVLARVVHDVPAVVAVTVGTADGIDIASVGRPARGDQQLAQLSSSLYALSAAAAGIDADEPADPLDMVHVSCGQCQIVVMAVPYPPAGPLLLTVVADGMTLGHVLVVAEAAIGEIAAVLAPGPQDGAGDPDRPPPTGGRAVQTGAAQ